MEQNWLLKILIHRSSYLILVNALLSAMNIKGDGTTSGRKRLIYVVQFHESKHPHFDIRLQFGNVLKSWAIPKGPPDISDKKFLAAQVEDHEISYGSWEGLIPEGMYGAGKVTIWDKGSYELVEHEPDKKIVVDIKGKKLKGKYCLIHFKPKEKNWLFFKIKD